jgi:hypothetical protein
MVANSGWSAAEISLFKRSQQQFKPGLSMLKPLLQQLEC